MKEGVGKKISVQLGVKKVGEDGAKGGLGGGERGKGGGGGFRKGGFRNAFAPVEGSWVDGMEKKKEEGREVEKMDMDMEDDSDATDQEDYYDPRKPTGCMPDCPGRVVLANG